MATLSFLLLVLLLAALIVAGTADTQVTLQSHRDPMPARDIVEMLRMNHASLGLDITKVEFRTSTEDPPSSSAVPTSSAAAATTGENQHHHETPSDDAPAALISMGWRLLPFFAAFALAIALVVYVIRRRFEARTIVYHQVEDVNATRLGALLCIMLLLGPTPSMALHRTYSNCKVLNPEIGYRLHWNVETASNKLQVALEGRAAGWLGLGLSTSARIGSMMDSEGLGSDMAIAYRGADCPGGCVHDYWSTQHELPQLDKTQNVTFVYSSYSDGVLTVEFDRNIQSRGVIEDEDLSVSLKRQMVIYAANLNEVPSNQGALLSYHGKNRGGLLIDFGSPSSCDRTYRNEEITLHLSSSFSSFNPTHFINRLSDALKVPPQRFAFVQADEPDFDCRDCEVDSWTFPDVAITPEMGQTNYMCVDFEFPANFSYHAIRFDPIINALSSPVVHHMILFSLQEPTGHEARKEMWNCESMPGAAAPLFVWAVGGSSFLPPSNVGFRVGKDAVRYASLQIHFNNPSLGSWRDSSGVRIYRTPHMREHNAGWGFLGQDLSKINLPPGIAYPSDKLTVSGNCPEEQVNDWTQHGDVHMFAYFMHAHLLGRKIVTDHWRNGARIASYSNDPYSFNYQHAVMGSWEIKPGDRLNTTCWYDSTDRDQYTTGGLASTDEMCFAVLAFWCDEPCTSLWSGRGCVEWDDDGTDDNSNSLRKRAERRVPNLGLNWR